MNTRVLARTATATAVAIGRQWERRRTSERSGIAVQLWPALVSRGFQRVASCNWIGLACMHLRDTVALATAPAARRCTLHGTARMAVPVASFPYGTSVQNTILNWNFYAVLSKIL